MAPLEPNLSLYVVTDRQLTGGRSIVEIVDQAIQGGATCIQLRDKDMSTRELYRLSLRLRELTRAKDILFIVNDRLDVALAAEADGVHLGQDDLPAAAARRIIPPEMILGISAENVQQALEAQEAGASYLGVGAIYSTTTKADAGESIGLKALSEICGRVHIPVVGIGGIDAGSARQVIEAGAGGVAVVSCVMAVEQVAEAAREVAIQVQNARASRQRRS